MILVDTNILLRYLLKDNVDLFETSKHILENQSDLFVTNEVMAEAVYVITKTYGIVKKEASIIFTELIDKNFFSLESKDIIIEAFKIFSNTSLDFVDCILCATNRIVGHKVETLDKLLKKCISNN